MTIWALCFTSLMTDVNNKSKPNKLFHSHWKQTWNLMLQPDGPKFMSMKISKTAPAQHYNHSLRLMNFWQFQVNCNTCNSHYMTKINVSLCHFYKKHLPWGPKVVSYKHPICCKINQHCKKNIRREKKRMNTAIILLKNKYGCPIWNTFIS